MKVVNKADFIAQLEVKDCREGLTLDDLGDGDIFTWSEGAGNHLFLKCGYPPPRFLNLDNGYAAIVDLRTGVVYQSRLSGRVVKVDCTLVIE